MAVGRYERVTAAINPDGHYDLIRERLIYFTGNTSVQSHHQNVNLPAIGAIQRPVWSVPPA